MRIEKFNELGDDSRLDPCGNRAVSVLVGDAFRLCLCRDCLAALTSEAEALEHELGRSCSKCRYYLVHPGGYDYCGRCGLVDKDTHYIDGNRSWLDTCEKFEEMSNGK